MMELKKYKLGELLEVTRGASLSGEYYATEGEFVRLTCGNFDYNNNCFKENTSKDNLHYVGPIKPEFIMKKGDIITPLTEQAVGLLGSTALIPESGKYIQSQDVAKIVCKEELLYPFYAYYLISSNLVKNQLSAGAQQTKIRHTSPDKIKDCTVWIPDIDNQKRIGDLLMEIDSKIFLNRKMNRTLEAMAKQLYDYWFVQFDFPDENGKPYKSSGGKMVWNEVLKREIPEGWEVKRLGELLSKLSSGKRPKGGIDKTLNEGIPSLGAECIDELGVFDFSSTPYLPLSYKDSIRSGIIEDKDILIYKDGAYVGKTTLFQDGFPFGFACVNEHVFLIHSKNEDLQEFLLFTLKTLTYYEMMQKFGKAKAAQPGLNQDDICSIPILLPAKEILKQYRQKIEAPFHLIFSQSLEIADLTRLRDELLPLLMNGQVEVKE